MIRDLIKWVAPGLATVLAGTTLCLAMTSTDIVNDVTARSTASMAAGGYDWAELSAEARDLTLRGTTTDQALLDSAMARLSALDGVRSVTADVTLAPMARPYILQASLDQSGISLVGGVPNEATRQRLMTLAGLGQGALDLRSGVPDRPVWVSGAEYAISQLQYLDQGQAEISDLTVNLTGRAKSERAFSDLLIALRAGAPAGVTLGEVNITPALVSPYSWNATFDGKRIDVSGHVPDDALVERYRTTDIAGLPVATGLTLGSGEPIGFAALSQTLIEQLARLEYGAASISDGESTLTGAPATIEIAQSVVDTLAPSGSIVVLEPPRIQDYWMSATRQAGGVVVFDGYVPDEATRESFALRDGADTSYLKLGRGAPERYRSGVDFGLDALALMSEGRIALRDTTLTIAGTARSSADYDALAAMINGQAPQGIVLAPAEILAPRASAYNWTASKASTGAIAISGLVPDAETAATILAVAGQSSTQSMTYASGEPAQFLASTETAIGLLQWLSEGKVVYDGLGWTLTGTANSAIDQGALDADFVTRKLAASGWSMAVAAPSAALPTVAPYIWSATKSPDGALIFTGQVPAESVRRFLVVRAGGTVTDETVVDPAAPAGFADDQIAALAVLAALSEGSVSFDGTAWTASGTLADAAASAAIDSAIAAATTPAQSWALNLNAPPAPAAEAVVAPETPAEPAPEAVDPNYAFSALLAVDASVVMSGQIPSDPAMRYFASISNGDVAAITIAPGAPATFLPSAEIGLRALTELAEGQLDFAQGGWSLRGVAADATQRDAALAAIAGDAGTTWQTQIDLPPPPAEPEPAPTSEPIATVPVDISACAAPVAEFSARNSILFQSGAALLAAESELALDELAVDLQACPNAVVHIEGHTDADGDDALNMALSVARAEAVVNALVSRGVVPARLYAVGYGESAPVADNATSEGKRLNRRIVVTVQPEHY